MSVRSLSSSVRSLHFRVLLLVAFATPMVLLCGLPLASEPEELEVVYLANEGFLLRAGDDMVLIDALFGSGLRGYGVVAAAEREKLESGAPPYDGVDLVLASHFHRDHFNAAAVARFMAANPSAQFVSTKQAARDLLKATPSLSSRTRGTYPEEGQIETLAFGNIALTLFNLHHGRQRPEIQNLGLLVEICGATVLHIGDSEAVAEDMRTAGLEGISPDVALLPSWYLRPSRWMPATASVISARRIVAMHLPTANAPKTYFSGGIGNLGELVSIIRGEFPGTFVPTEGLERTSIPCRRGD